MKEELGKTYWIELSCMIRSIHLPCGVYKVREGKIGGHSYQHILERHIRGLLSLPRRQLPSAFSRKSETTLCGS